jgi:hypothetical protein
MQSSMLSLEIKDMLCIMESALQHSWTLKQTGSNFFAVFSSGNLIG